MQRYYMLFSALAGNLTCENTYKIQFTKIYF